MPAYNFKKQFVALIESNKKRQTIRANRKDGRKPKAGDVLYLYTGMRTKACQKLREVICKSVQEIMIDQDYIKLQNKTFMVNLTWHERFTLAFADGFKKYDDFMIFFEKTHGLPFHGNLIKW